MKDKRYFKKKESTSGVINFQGYYKTQSKYNIESSRRIAWRQKCQAIIITQNQNNKKLCEATKPLVYKSYHVL